MKLIKSFKKILKKSFKNIKLSYKELQYLNEKFTKFHWLPEIICYQYKKDFGFIFSVCFKTLYKYIKLGLYGLNKRNIYFKVKNYKTTQKLDNRGQFMNRRTIKEAIYDKYEFGWFEMDTIVGKDFKSRWCLA